MLRPLPPKLISEHISRLICVIVLACFTASTSLAALADCCSLLQQHEKNPAPTEKAPEHCQQLKDSESPASPDEPAPVDLGKCCQDMGSCSGLSVYLGTAPLAVADIQSSNARPSLDENLLLSPITPPTPPPKF